MSTRSALTRTLNGVFFFLAFPLALIGFSAVGVLAVFRGVTEGAWGYSVIFVVGMVMLGIVLRQAFRMQRALEQMDKDIEAMRR